MHTGLIQALRLLLLGANPWIVALFGGALIAAGLTLHRDVVALFGLVLLLPPLYGRLTHWRRRQRHDEP